MVYPNYDAQKAVDVSELDGAPVYRVKLIEGSGIDLTNGLVKVVQASDPSNVALWTESDLATGDTFYIDCDLYTEVAGEFIKGAGTGTITFYRSSTKDGSARDAAGRGYVNISQGITIENGVALATSYSQDVAFRINTNGSKYIKAIVTVSAGTVDLQASGAPRR